MVCVQAWQPCPRLTRLFERLHGSCAMACLFLPELPVGTAGGRSRSTAVRSRLFDGNSSCSRRKVRIATRRSRSKPRSSDGSSDVCIIARFSLTNGTCAAAARLEQRLGCGRSDRTAVLRRIIAFDLRAAQRRWCAIVPRFFRLCRPASCILARLLKPLKNKPFPMQERYEAAAVERAAQDFLGRTTRLRSARKRRRRSAASSTACRCSRIRRAGCTWATCATTPSATCSRASR